MNKIKTVQLLILLIIFLSMLAIIFIGRLLFFSNDTQTYQPSSSSVKVKASQKTYSKFIVLNQNSSLTSSSIDLTPTDSISENQPLPTSTEEISPTLANSIESPTPTEIILTKAVSPTDNPELISESTLGDNQIEEVPASGFYQNLQWLFLISTLIIFFSFIL